MVRLDVRTKDKLQVEAHHHRKKEADEESGHTPPASSAQPKQECAHAEGNEDVGDGRQRNGTAELAALSQPNIGPGHPPRPGGRRPRSCPLLQRLQPPLS